MTPAKVRRRTRQPAPPLPPLEAFLIDPEVRRREVAAIAAARLATAAEPANG